MVHGLERGEPFTDRRQLVEYIAQGSKPREAWRIGTEHEKFVFFTEDLRPVPYEGERGIQAVLEGLARDFGWQPIHERERVIALVRDGCSITLEPGGQLELSGDMLTDLHQTCSEVHSHLREVKSVLGKLKLAVLGAGFLPKWTLDEIPWMPKGRYRIMRDYMPKRGGLGLDMMTRSCTVQVNLDYADEADMVRKFRVSLALQPIATALFANSPFKESRPNGYLSYRSHIWTDTDPDRTGLLDFVFEDSFGFERYVDYILDVPMYFVQRDGAYIDMAGRSFRDFMAGQLQGLEGELPGKADWADHLTTAFPEVRLKKFLEMRGADAGPWGALCALPALWTGLLYDQTSLDAAYDMISAWTLEELHGLRDAVPTTALGTPFRGRPLYDTACEVVALARAGLQRRARKNEWGRDEAHYLEPLEDIIARKETLAETMLRRFHTDWHGDIDRLYRDHAY
ncbi:MAG: glutamate--cysteine ligase [Geminicoccaceae bacterium]